MRTYLVYICLLWSGLVWSGLLWSGVLLGVFKKSTRGADPPSRFNFVLSSWALSALQGSPCGLRTQTKGVALLKVVPLLLEF